MVAKNRPHMTPPTLCHIKHQQQQSILLNQLKITLINLIFYKPPISNKSKHSLTLLMY